MSGLAYTGSAPAAGTGQSLRHDAIIVRLFFVWTVLQCFFYGAIPYLRWNLGIGVNVTPDKLAFVAMVLVLLVRPKTSSERSRGGNRADTMVAVTSLVFTIVAMASWWINEADSNSKTFGQLTRVLNLALFPAVVYFVARHVQYTRAMLNDLLRLFAVFGIYLSATAIAEHYNLTALIFPKYIIDPSVGVQFGRSRGPFANTIGNGGMLLLSFLALACLSVSANGVRRIVSLFLTFIFVPAIYFTETRSVWLSCAVVTVTIVILRTPVRTVGSMLSGVLLIAFVVGAGSKFSMFEQTLFSRRPETVDYRLDNYQIAWDAFKAHPLFGLGDGRLQLEWQKYADLKSSRRKVGLDDGNHSTILGVLAEFGLIGTVPFALMFASAAFVCGSAYRQLQPTNLTFERSFLIVAIGALEICVLLGLTSDLRTSPTVNITAFWFVGVISSLVSAQRESAAGRTIVPENMLPNRRPAARSFGRKSL